MTALECLRLKGLTVESVAGKLRVSPADKITPLLRQHIFIQKAELLAELKPASAQAKTEELKEERYTLTAATASHEWRETRDRYVTHLMKCRACHAPTNRFCSLGRSARELYDSTPMSGIDCKTVKNPACDPRVSFRDRTQAEGWTGSA